MGKEQDLLEASRSGQYNIIEKILNARVKKTGPLNLTSLRRIPGPNTTDPRNGFTCLHYASLNGHKNIVRILLEHGANPNVIDHNGSSPLHLASWTGDYEIVDMLISNNNDLKAQIDLKNNENESPLHLACRYGHTPVVSLLLTQGADPFIQNIRQETPLDLAAQYGRLETVELLLRLRFDLLNEYLPSNHKNDRNNNDTPNEDQETRMNHHLADHSPLHLASRNGHKSIVKLLLDLGFDVDYLTKNGTALFESVICGKNEIVRLLLEAGTNVELRNEKGQKVEQLLDGLNTAVAKQTKKLIREHISVTKTDHGYDGSTNRTLDSDEQAMLMRMISSPVTISESISTTIAASNSFCDQEDLTIVDSMLNEDIPIMYDHRRHHNLNDDDLMDDTDNHCISPPPGYTDNNNQNDDHQDGHHMLGKDCVSPSSSLFSTSIFSELASIFEEHLQRNPMDRNFNDHGFHQLQDNSSGQIKSSNSFTLIGTDHNSFNEVQNYHQPHEIPSFHSPNRRMTTPNLIPNDHLHCESHPKMMSTSLNSNNSSSDGGELRKYFWNSTDNQERDNDRDSIIVSSNYSISSNASSSNARLNSNDETTTAKLSSVKQARPPKPPRKSIDKLHKAKSMECRTVIITKEIENIDLKKSVNIEKAISSNLMMSKSTNESNGSSDVADSSDHSASQNVDSVISNDPKTKYSIQKIKKKEISPIKYEIHSKANSQSGNQLPSMSSGHSIDDFYMLYDQAAREEYENDKEVVRNCLFNQSSKHSNSMDLLKKKEEEEVALVSANTTIKTIVKPKLMVQDPPSPNSAETEIIHKIEPLKQQFYDQKPAITKRHKRKKTLEASVIVSEKDKRFTDAKNTKTSCHNDHSMIKCDNWTLTDDDVLILNNSDALEQKEKLEIQPQKESIGINVQLGDDYRNVKGAKLITECGKEGQELSNVHNNHHRHRNKKQSQAVKHGQRRNDQQKTMMGQENNILNNHTNTKNNDYFSAYCETLKFDRKGEKENPFAGLCRGGLTPAKSNPNHHRKEQQQQSSQSQQQPNGTMEKKKKTVELSEARKSLRKQRSILSGRAESLSKLNKLSVYNGGSQDFSDNNNNNNGDGNCLDTSISKSIDQRSNNSNNGNSAMITQPNNIYATLRKKKKSKSLNGDHHLTVMVANDTNNKNNIDNNIGHEDDHEVHRNGSTTKTETTSNAISSIMDQSQQILLWLDEIGMKHYRDLLIQNGYDDLDFMDNNVMDDNDLIEIGIIQASHRELILNAAKQLPYKTPKLTRDQILTFSVAQWLQQLHLKQYVSIFHSNGLIELKKIRHLWEIELDIMLDIDKIGHRRRILFSLSDLKSRDSLIVSDNSDALSPWLTDNASTCTNLEREREREQIEWKGWKHSRHELVNGSCQYLVSYLGSTLVRELRGIDSTRASIGKLKASGEQQQHMKILLSISCQGVQFKDPKSNKLICEHEIRNIHCICQDSEDLNYFAYITKDFESNNHYCHVFMSKQTDLVTEIILTLGQAFEIAYQIVLEQYNIHVKQQQQQNSSSDNNLTNNSNHNGIQSSNSSNYTTYIKGNNQNYDFKKQTALKNGDQQHNSFMSSINNNNNSKDDNDKKDSSETLLQQISSKHENVFQNTVKEKNLIDHKTASQKENIQERETRNESNNNVPASIEPVNVGGGEEEQLYAVVDKSRKTKKQLSQQSQSLSSTTTTAQDENFENRPIPPIRSSSTASSNSSTGPRPEQQQNKPKPPIRVASMQNQQKPEVSPKPKNLINKSNTVQLASSNLNNKPVLARFCAHLQPEQQSQKPNHFNSNNNVTSLSSNSSSSTINNLHSQTKQFHQKF